MDFHSICIDAEKIKNDLYPQINHRFVKAASEDSDLYLSWLLQGKSYVVLVMLE